MLSAAPIRPRRRDRVAPDVDGYAKRHELISLLNLGVGHGDTSRGPIHQVVQRTQPGPSFLNAVNLNLIAGRNPQQAGAFAVPGIRIGDVQGAMKAAARGLRVE